MRSLYVHFPFCEAKCHYCDFYSIGRERTGAGDPLLFEEALFQECRQAVPRLDAQIDTIFFGGGTPSMTPPESMRKALAPLELEKRIHAGTEWTMEANPSSVDRETLRAYRALGLNRISMGVQALRPDLLVSLGRVHSREAAFQALDAIFEAGFTNVSVDLLCGVPNQSVADVERAMDELTRYPITHLSCYLLTLPKTHRMFRDLPNEVEQLAHLLAIDRYMTGKGFEHYEISNFAKPGFRARHNLAYWTGSSYLALGPSAHGYDAAKGERWKNVSALHKYATVLAKGESPIEWRETLTPEQREMEKWLLALRLSEGFDRAWLNSELRRKKAEAFVKEGLLEAHPAQETRLRLTPRGFALSDQIISAFAG
jgi:oxygen-independent coproporphyrinogen-3 oxidase